MDHAPVEGNMSKNIRAVQIGFDGWTKKKKSTQSWGGRGGEWMGAGYNQNTYGILKKLIKKHNQQQRENLIYLTIYINGKDQWVGQPYRSACEPPMEQRWRWLAGWLPKPQVLWICSLSNQRPHYPASLAFRCSHMTSFANGMV